MSGQRENHSGDPEKKRLTVPELIDQSAKAAAQEVLHQQRQARNLNLYRATERLLRSYKRFQRWEENPEEYGFFPTAKSKDISVAPPPGLGLRDKVELNEEFVSARQASFERTMARYYDIKAVVEQFQDKPEFIVIRMYYFGEDVYGHDRGPDAKRYTFEDIVSELSSIGIERSIKTLCIWRSTLVQDMTVLLFGVEGAVSIEAREPKQGQKGGKAPTDDGQQ